MQKGIAIVLLIVLALTGCANSNSYNNMNAETTNEEEESTVKSELNDRQKKICEIEGWSQNPSEWDGIQENTVSRADKCLEYLEETYPEDEFEYLGFTLPGFMGSGTSYLEASSKLAGKGHNVTVTIFSENDGYRFADNYGPAVESNAYAEEVAKFVRERYPEAEMFYVGRINTKKYEQGEENIITRASGSVDLVMNNVFGDEYEVKVLLTDISTWLYENRPGESKIVDILVLADDDMKNANIDNYIQSYYKQYRFVYSCNSYIDYDGEISINSR